MERFWNQLGITPVTRVLDVGGTPYNWRLVASRPRVILANMKLQLYKRGEAGLSWVIGDGRRLPFRDQAIDVVFCNSVIEHVGGFEDQSLLAAECRRVGRRYWVQTPNKTFPVEPHLMTPFIHWLPRRVQRRLLRNFTLWGLLNRPTEERCDRFMREVRLLSASEMRRLFRDAEIWQERVLGLSKSLVAIKK